MLLESSQSIEHEPQEPTPELLAILRRERELEAKLLSLRKNNEIEFFVPHKKQCWFYENATYHFRYARTGNRFGKSEMGAAEDVSFALGYRPWYPIGHPLRTLGIPSHPTKGLIVCTTWKKSREVFTALESGTALGKLFKYIPKEDLIEYTKNHTGFIDRIVVRHHRPDGKPSGENSLILLTTIESFKKNPLSEESSVHDWAHIDEPIPQDMWNAIVRGFVDRGARAWFTCTPLSEPWIDIAFVPNLQDQSHSQVGQISDPSTSRWMMDGSMDDNPHLTKEDIERTLSWYSDDEKECRRKGIPIAYSGIIYKEFSWSTHVQYDLPPGWETWAHPPADWCIRYAIDYHPKKPDAILFLATSPDGYTYAYHEIWKVMLCEEEAEEIKKVLNGHIAQPGLVDPLASTPNKVTDITQLQMYRKCGLAVLPATKDPPNGIRAVKELLKARDKFGKPIFKIGVHLKQTLFEISRGYIWDENGEKPLKQDDDMMENLYRLALQRLHYIEPPHLFDYTPIGGREIPPYEINPFEFDPTSPPPKRSKFNPARYR